jgi:hypothetical protein
MAGPPTHKPTKETIAVVKSLARFGIRQEFIARQINVSVPTLYKHYQSHMDDAVDHINAEVANVLYEKAMAGNLAAVTFWLKCRARWTERHEHQITGKDGKALNAKITVEYVESTKGQSSDYDG